jgi:hypothetical protein
MTEVSAADAEQVSKNPEGAIVQLDFLALGIFKHRRFLTSSLLRAT